MQQQPSEFLAGGGEMGARMRQFAWQSTPLGPVGGWPQSLRTIVRMMLDSRFAMWMAWGPDLTFFCNDAYLPTLGIKREWALGSRSNKVWEEIWHDIGPRIDHVIGSGEATWDEGLRLFLLRSGYEEETFHTFSYSPVFDEANRVAGMLCVVVEETDRVLSERRLNLLRDLASVPAGDAHSLTVMGARLLERVRDSPYDLPFAALHLSAGADAQPVLAGTTTASGSTQALQYAQRGDGLCGVSIAMSTRAPQLVDVASSGLVLAGAWSEPIQFVLAVPLHLSGNEHASGCVVLGVSTRRKLDEAYRTFLGLVSDQFAAKLSDVKSRLDAQARVDALAELDRAKNVFFGNVSHELRTPLTLLLGPLDKLARMGLAPDIDVELQLAQRNGLRLKKLVNSLLDFSRIEAGRADATFRATDLAGYTADLAALFRAAIEDGGLRFTVSADRNLPPVYVDRDMWEKVVVNLLSNAFKFTFEGSIDVSLSQVGSAVRLRVQDTGCGIPPAHLPRIFERFQRVSGAPSRVSEGTGIGLAFVRELIRLHGGTVTAQSVVGQGTTFDVTVPLGHAHLPADALDTGELHPVVNALDASVEGILSNAASPLAITASVPAAPGAAETNGRRRLLVVDDNADMRQYLSRLLCASWDVRLCADGLQALNEIDASRPDLVITDVMMPNMTGIEFIRRVRAKNLPEHLPIIVLSARAGDEARVAGLNDGADDYIVKPFSANELLARVDVQLMRSRVRRAEEARNRQLADLFRDAPVGVAILRGPDHVFEFANAAYSQFVLDRPLIGLAMRDAFPEFVDQGFIALLDQVRSSNVAYRSAASQAVLLESGAGDTRRCFFEFVYQPLEVGPGEEQAIAVIAIDVTQLTLAREGAEAANRAKDEFMAILGHELRNPLAPIRRRCS